MHARVEPRFGAPARFDLWVVADSIPHIVWTATSDGSTEYLNRRGTDYAGLDSMTDDGDVAALFHPDDTDRVQRSWDRAVANEKSFEVDCRIRRHDGVYRWHTLRSLPVRDENSGDIRWVGTATDIEDRRNLESELRWSNRTLAETVTFLETLQSTAPVGIGFVDRDYRIVRLNDVLASINGGTAQAQLGRTVADVVPTMWAQVEHLYRSVLDGGEAIVNREIASEIAAEPGRTHWWLASYYPVRLDQEVIGVGIVAIDITERREAEDERKRLTFAAVEAIAATIDERDPYTAGHQRRVANIARAIATELQLDANEVDGIGLAAAIHDIGKIRVPAEILNRPGGLTPAEMELVKVHPRTGHNILAGIDFPWPIADMVLQHHERLDGSGYPDGLHDHEILLGARIIAAADTVEAMATDRPYRFAPGIAAALEVLQNGRATVYDPDVVDACLRLHNEGRLDLTESHELPTRP